MSCDYHMQASMVHGAIVTALGLCLRFRQCWEMGVARFGRRAAAEIEAEFSRCVYFLVSCLNKTVQKRPSPHCEYS